jgi:hypothetical protein
MDEYIKRISEGVASHSSRRGFLSTMGKAVLGAAAIIGGQGLFAQAAEASPACCTNGGTYTCYNHTCPSGSWVQYTWRCGVTSCHYYVCHDCKTGSGRLVCVYATYRYTC